MILLSLQSLSLLSVPPEILIAFRGHRKGKFVLSGLMDFFSRIFHKFEYVSRMNSHFSFLDTHSFQHFQFWKTQGTILLHFAKIREREWFLQMKSRNFLDLMVFPEPFFCDKPTRSLEMVRLHDMPNFWIWSETSDICLLFIQVKRRCT